MALKTHMPGAHSRAPESDAGLGKRLKKLPGQSRSDKHSHPTPCTTGVVNADLYEANGDREEGPRRGGVGMTQ